MKRFSRLIAFVLVVAMTVSLFANGQMSIFAEEENNAQQESVVADIGTSTNYGVAIGSVAEFKDSSVVLNSTATALDGTTIYTEELPAKVVVVDFEYDDVNHELFYKIDSAPGEMEWAYEGLHWVYANELNIISEGLTSIFGAENKVLSMGVYDKPVLTAESSLQGAVEYQWQICYDVANNLWVDIYSEDEAELTVTIGMLATLLLEDGTAMLRCVSESASKCAISDSIKVVVDFSDIGDTGDGGTEEPEVPVAPTLDICMDGAAVASVTTTYGNYDFEKTLTISTTLSGALTYKWEMLTDETNNQWQELSAEESVTISYVGLLSAFKYYDETSDVARIRLTISNGETELTDTFTIYRIAEASIQNSVGDTTGTVDVTVAGSIPDEAVLNLTPSDDGIAGVEPSEIALALDVTITQYGEEWQPAEGETVRVSIPAAQLGLSDGQYFAVYHIHDGATELLGPYKVENGYVTFDIDGFSVVVISTNYGAAIGGTAEWDVVSTLLASNHIESNGDVMNGVSITELPEKVAVQNYYFDEVNGTLWYKLTAAPGYTWPAAYENYRWVYGYVLKNINFDGEMGIYNIEGNAVTEATVSTTESITVKAITSLQSSDISYVWQICYDIANDQWVDITGENSAEITINAGMIASLMDENYQAKIRCVTTVLSKSVVSEPITVTLANEDDGEDSQEPFANILIDNINLDSIDVNDADKYDFASTLTVNTNLVGELTYSWEVLSNPTNGLWDVLGENDTFHPIFDMWGEGTYIGHSYYIQYVDAATSAITIRLRVSNGVSELQDTFIVNLKYETEETTAEPMVAMYTSMARGLSMASADNGIATVAEEGSTVTYNVIIEYLNADGTNAVADPYTSTVSPTTILTNTVSFPTVQGYVPMVYDQDSANWVRKDSYTFDGSYFTSDFTLKVRYYPDAVNYTVNIYTQNAENDEYALLDSYIRQELTGTVLEEIKITIDGFYQSKFTSNSAAIAADGSTVFNLYYDRIYYLMKFDLDGGYGVQPVYARHGTKLDIPNPTKAGCTFVGWDQTEGTPAVNTDNLGDGIQDTIYTNMPIGNTAYKAIWKAVDNAKVTIVYWGENPNDEGYSYLESQELYVKPGTELTFGTDQLICTLTEHTHGSGCTYDCGKTPHTHSLDNDCYKLNCSINTHSHADSGCTLNCTHTHELSCYSTTNLRTLKKTTQPSNLNANSGNGIYTYTTSEWYGTATHYYLCLNEEWYCAYGSITGSKADEQEITLSCTHGHTDICYSCGLNESSHVHSLANNCYTLACTIEAHTHTDDCYSCIKHTHNDDCYLKTTNQDATLWTLVKSETVTVAADGSTVMNVYYDRVTYNVEFHSNQNCTNEYTDLRITAKWGASILDKWPTYNGSSSWLVEDKSDTWQNSIQIMPVGGAKFWGPKTGSSSYTAYYYVEALSTDTDTIVHNGVTYKFHHTDVSSSKGNVTVEEQYEMEGYEYKEGTSIGSSYSDAKFYYVRRPYVLEFNNGEDVVKTESVKYQYSLSSYDFIPTAPSYYEAGSVEFAGWYQNPECTGEEVDFTSRTMPASNMIVYAKWVPVTHDVTVYRYINEDGTFPTGEDILLSTTPVSHGSLLQEQYIPEDPSNGNYTFIGWFYKDGDKEIAFDFENMTVTQDLQIYAKWSSNVQIPYTIKYIIDGTTTKIADDTTGKQYAGETHTFSAKTAGQLYEKYQTGYFPLVSSHSIAFNEDDSSYEYTFYYVKRDPVPYNVYYVTEIQNEEKSLTPIELTEVENGVAVTNTYYIVADTKSATTPNAIVTENYETVGGYMPDAYQKTLIINGSEDAVNQIIFKYSKNTTQAYYKVTHYTQELNGTWFEHASYENIGTIGDYYTEGSMTITGFTYDHIEYVVNDTKVEEGDITNQGVKLTADGLEINLYYTRNKYPYKVQYINQDNNDVLWTDTFDADTEKEYYAKVVEHTAPQYYGEGDIYERVSAETLSTTILVEEDSTNIMKNVITFYYKEREVTINYVAVGPDGVTDFGSVSASRETIKVSTGIAEGSKALEINTNYKFVGWYDNEDCSGNPMSTNVEFVPQKPESNIWESVTYYAKFELNVADLTITKNVTGSGMRDEDSFLFYIQGASDDENTKHINIPVIITYADIKAGNGFATVKNLPVGTYVVTEDTAWSWRYQINNNTPDQQTIMLGADDNKVSFSNECNEDKWLTDTDVKENTFTATSSN